MRFGFQNKFINILLLFTIFCHLSFLHSITENYVLCVGNDGHIALENITDNKSCKFDLCEQTLIGKVAISLDNTHCKDIPFHRDCFEENQFMPDKKNLNSLRVLLLGLTFILPEFTESSKHNKIFEILESFILKNYSTVSLII
jgi:hypothetical protein